MTTGGDGHPAPRLRPPVAGEAEGLTALCLRSKAHWGYDTAFMAACREELTLDEADLSSGKVRIADLEGRAIGVAEISLEGEDGILEKLFVAPEAMGKGAGRLLLEWAVEACRGRGARRLVIDADPDAAAFYRRCGAVDAGQAPSESIPGRMLPRLVIDL